MEGAAVIGFKNSQGGVEQLALGHDDKVEAWRDLIMTENLSYQSFSAIPLNRASQFLRRGYSQPADIELVGQDEERAVATVDADTVLVSLLKISATTDALIGAKFHQLTAYSLQLSAMAKSRETEN